MHCIANQPERGNRSRSADCAQCTLHCALCRDWECVSAKCGQCIVSNSGFVLAPFAGFCRGHLTRSQSALRNTMLQAEENKPKRGTERRMLAVLRDHPSLAGLQDPIDNKIILLRLTFGRHQTFHHEGQSPVCRKQGKSSQTDFEILRQIEDWARIK